MGSERVNGCATKTNWKQRCSSQALIPLTRNFVKVVARILRRILVTLYIYKNLIESTTVCSLRSLRSLALNYHESSKSLEGDHDRDRVRRCCLLTSFQEGPTRNSSFKKYLFNSTRKVASWTIVDIVKYLD